MFVITVPSSKPGKVHTVRKVSETVWTCDCQDHIYRSKGMPYVCKHIAQIAASIAVFATMTEAKSKSAVTIIQDALA